MGQSDLSSNHEEADQTKPTPNQRVYACTKCTKTYGRRDYLERHALNHNRPTSICESCGKSFARPDVLRKHQNSTCKGDPNLIRDGTSSSSSTPSKSLRDRLPRKRKRKGSSIVPDAIAMSNISGQGHDQSRQVEAGTETHTHTLGEVENRDITTSTLDTQRYGAWSVSETTTHQDSIDNLRGSTLHIVGTHTADTYQVDLPTTEQPQSQDGPTIIAGEEFHWTSPIPTTGDNMDDLLSWLFNPSPENMLSQQGNLSMDNHEPEHHQTSSFLMAEETNNISLNPGQGQDQDGILRSPDLVHHQNTNPPLSSTISISQRPPSRMRSTYPENYEAYVPQPKTSQNIYPDLSERWAAWTPWQHPLKRDIIDEEVRAEMLDLFDNNARRELLCPTFSIQQMRLYLELYFMHFAPLYPIIHEPSLPYRKLAPDLLLAMVCVGTAFANDSDGIEIASKIHKHLRNRVFDMVEDEPTASVSSLQTVLLLNHFARSYCSLKQHDLAQIFHSPIINLARQSGMLLPNFDRKLQQNSLGDPIACWLEWITEEERKRLGWFAFLMDTENAALYRGFLLIHCYLIQIDLPAPDEVWESPNPITWNKTLNRSSPPTSFRNLLRDLAGRGYIQPNLSKLTLWLLIHGLHCVQWTLLWRDLGDLSMVHVSKITNWKDSLRVAFDKWREYIDHEHNEHSGNSGSNSISTTIDIPTKHTQNMSGLKSDEHPMISAGIPFSHLGSVLLLSDSEQIRIFAGTKKIAGRPISPGEWAAANIYVNSWAKSQDGAYCCHAALRLLAHVFRWSSESKFQKTSMVPWCVYIATLIVWSYSSALDGLDQLQTPFIIITPSPSRANPESEPQVRIEPSLAHRDAVRYLDNMLSVDHPFGLPSVKNKNKCAGIVAYTAYLAGTLKRGVMEECRTVLLGLLTEHV